MDNRKTNRHECNKRLLKLKSAVGQLLVYDSTISKNVCHKPGFSNIFLDVTYLAKRKERKGLF